MQEIVGSDEVQKEATDAISEDFTNMDYDNVCMSNKEVISLLVLVICSNTVLQLVIYLTHSVNILLCLEIKFQEKGGQYDDGILNLVYEKETKSNIEDNLNRGKENLKLTFGLKDSVSNFTYFMNILIVKLLLRI